MRFEVFDVEKAVIIDEFGDPREAQARAKNLKLKGRKIKINKRPEIGGDDTWKTREEARFIDGTYQYVPWHAMYIHFALAHHFCHMSTSMDGTVAYTPDDEYGRRDKQIKIKPYRYLREFFPHLNDLAVRQWSDMCLFRYNSDIDMIIARTKDEIETVYRSGPSSCMSGPLHPVGAWASEDFGVAYIKHRGNKHAAARTVVCVTKKVYARIYGDGGAYTTLLGQKLKDAGYVHADRASRNWMQGMKLCPENTNGRIPTIDFQHCGGEYNEDRTIFVFNGSS